MLYSGEHRKAADLNAIYLKKYFPIDNNIEIPTEIDTEEKYFHNFSQLQKLDNKLDFRNFCSSNGLPVLPAYYHKVAGPGDFVLKPVIGSGSIGIEYLSLKSGEVRDVKPNYYAEMRANGPTYGVGVVVNEGKILEMCSWKRLKTFPKSGGPSIHSKLICDEQINLLSKNFCHKTSEWKASGCFMLEFIKHGDEIYFLEINPRIWGSVALMECSGHNFTKSLCRALYDIDLKVRDKDLFKGKHYFCNPILAPTGLFSNSSATFYTGFSGRSQLQRLFYFIGFFRITQLKKLWKKFYAKNSCI